MIKEGMRVRIKDHLNYLFPEVCHNKEFDVLRTTVSQAYIKIVDPPTNCLTKFFWSVKDYLEPGNVFIDEEL